MIVAMREPYPSTAVHYLTHPYKRVAIPTVSYVVSAQNLCADGCQDSNID